MRKLFLTALAGVALAATATHAQTPQAPAVQAQSSVTTGPSQPAPVLAPDAAAALDRMGAHLRSLQSFQVRSDATTEQVYPNGQKLQFLQHTTYTVQLPDRMLVEIKTDGASRRVFYDGKAMTLVGDRAKKYVTFPVSGPLGAVLTKAYENYGIDFPLQDLFRWGDPSSSVVSPTEGFKVGDSMIGDTKVEHFAFRQPGVDFQLWLTPGDKPLPRKMVITTLESPAQPQYVAYFTWNLQPTIADGAFTFVPGKDFQLVDFGTANAAGAK